MIQSDVHIDLFDHALDCMERHEIHAQGKEECNRSPCVGSVDW